MVGTVGIYHLVRAANGLEPFRAFVESFRRAVPPGDRWRLVTIFKGFRDAASQAPYLELVAGLPLEAISISDDGYDISSYYKATDRTEHQVLAFFNSFAEILEPRWYELMLENLEKPGVGLVGATGSLESVVRNHVIYGGAARTLAEKTTKYALAAGLLALFPPFPNPHVRTNAFMIRRQHFLATRRYPVDRRLASLVFEAGWWSLTRQIQSKGLEVLVVDRQGRGLAPDDWANAGVFRSGDQSNVLVRDNRIREFEDASEARKRELRWYAWGDRYERRS